MTRTRFRTVASDIGYQPWSAGTSGVKNYGYPFVAPLSDVQVTTDEVNQVSLLGSTREDVGGPFESITISVDHGNCRPIVFNPKYYGRGALSMPMPPLNNLLGTAADQAAGEAGFSLIREAKSWNVETDVRNKVSAGNPFGIVQGNTLDAFGTSAINRCRPTTPAVDLATSVAEVISEWGFFSIPGSSGSSASEYLNYQLGISPVLSDIVALRKAMKDSEEIIAQYERDAGKLVRREYIEDEVTDVKKFVSVGDKLPFSYDGISPVYWFSSYGTLTVIRSTSMKRWFNGAFTYSLPEAGWRRTLSELDQAYGIIPGVDTAWELVPLSFVADYFANLGDVLGNTSSFIEDGLVMPYGYVMWHSKIKYHCIWEGPLSLNGLHSDQVRLVADIDIDVKQRQPATPFGFGFDFGDITPRQLSILAALGITRAGG